MRAVTVGRLGLVGFAAAIALAGVAAWGAFRVVTDLRDATLDVRHTLRVREQAEIVLSLMKDAETAQRGFVVTGREAYLQPYETTRALLPRHLDALRSVVAGDAQPAADMTAIESLIRDKVREVDETVAARRQGGLEAAARVIESGHGKETMDRLRESVGRLLEAEARRFSERAAVEKRRARVAIGITTGGLVLAVLLLAGVAVLLTLATRQREREQAARDAAEAAAQASQASEARLAVTLASIGDGVIATDERGRVTTMNPVAQRLTGWAEAEAAGRPLDEVVHLVNEQTGQPAGAPMGRVRNGRVVGLTGHTALRARDGREIPVDDSAAPIEGPDGRALGVVMVFRDVTERRSQELARAEMLRHEREARQRAERASQSKDEFVAMLSHELRTPLSAIVGWVHLLRTAALTPEARERALDVIQRSTRTQMQLIEDLLDASAIITGNLRVDRRATDVAAVVEAAVEAVRPALFGKGLELRTQIEPVPSISADPDRLQQVVSNLMTNAVKFTPAGGTITVSLRRRDADVELQVRDTGCGIDPAFLPHVFDRFQQAPADAPASARGGLGLGLAIVQRIVSLHDGVVLADSAGAGQGACFTVRLPVPAALDGAVAAPLLRRMPDPAPPRAQPLEGMRVLVVEDQADARELIAVVLEHAGARVTGTASAAEALRAFVGGDFDAIVSDIGLPDGDGYKLLQRIRQRGRTVPAIALTAYTRVEDRERALAAGFQLHVAKPIEPTRLVAALSSACPQILPSTPPPSA